MTKNLLATIIISVTIILIFMFVVPAYDQLKAVRQTRSDRQELLVSNKRSRDAITKLHSSYVDHKADVQRLMIALPVKKEVDYLSSSVEHAASSTGTQLASLNINDPVKQGMYQTIPARLEVSCKYPSCIQFIETLESSLRLYDIGKISMAQSSAASGTGFLTMSLVLTAYSIK